MPTPLTKSSTILIIGGGTWGASTALYLARRGYENVTVLDPYAYPSPISAGNDVNKIVETISWRPTNTPADDSVSVSTHLSALASIGWKEDPIFSPYYHETGYITAASTPEGLDFVEQYEIVGDKSDYNYIEGVGFRQTMREGVLTGEFPNWKGYAKESGGGWAHARKAMVSACAEAERLGVEFVSGDAGKVVSLVFDEGDDVVGAKTADAKEHRADRTIMAAGPYADQLLDFEDQLRPTAWTLCHIKISDEELEMYKNLPVMFNVERGFFMEPDEDRHELKICDEHPGYVNFASSSDGDITVESLPPTKRSTPFAKHQVPKAAADRVRLFLKEAMPHLADRPFCFARICWCADTPDRMFLIDTHPKHPSLVLGVGGSGHGYAHIPSVGGLIADEMEGKLAKKFQGAFKWRPETAINRDWKALQGRWGAERKVMDLAEVKEWTEVGDGRVWNVEDEEWVVV